MFYDREGSNSTINVESVKSRRRILVRGGINFCLPPLGGFLAPTFEIH